MAFDFMNYAMLAGMAAMALPVIAHLLSKRKFDVVQWGAMQFLELGTKTRRRIRLQDWLLLALRMLLIGLVVAALARPWGQGGVFGQFSNGVGRDVVFIVDSSYSMGWEGKAVTPHAAGIDWIHAALEDLQPGDTAGLIDARTQTHALVSPPVTDLKRVREQLNEIAPPSGTSDLTQAITDAMQTLSAGSNVSREVIVITDGQELPWKLEDQLTWQRIAELREQPSIPPKVYAVNVGSELRDLTNYSVNRIELSRAMTVPDFPIRLRSTIRQSGGENTQRKVFLEVNGQRIQAQSTDVALLPNGEALVEFEHRFEAVGAYVVSVSLDADNLPADNRADAVIVVADGIRVLLVDGDHQLDPIRCETFFLKSAFDATGTTSWVRADVIQPEQLAETQLSEYRVVFLCNVPRISGEESQQLAGYAAAGGGVVIAPGDKVDATAWNSLELATGVPFVPLDLGEVKNERSVESQNVTVDHQSLNLPWLERFRKEGGVDFAETRFGRWWSLAPRTAVDAPPTEQPLAVVATDAATGAGSVNEVPPALTLATLSTGEPLLVSREWGEGQIMLFATPLDADWNTLPARNDFVPFVHELVFALTTTGPSRNVDVGSALLLPLPKDSKANDWVVSGPATKQAPVTPTLIANQPGAQFTDARLTGVYYFHRPGAAPESGEPFVLDFDRTESNMKPLDDAGWADVTQDGRIVKADTMAALTAQLKQDNSRTELWWLLLFGVLGLLVVEVAMTRQMVKGGHAALDIEPVVA